MFVCLSLKDLNGDMYFIDRSDGSGSRFKVNVYAYACWHRETVIDEMKQWFDARHINTDSHRPI